MFDAVTEQVLAHVDRLGYRVGILDHAGGHQFTAENRKTGEQTILRGEDPYAVACELAAKVDIRIDE